MSGASLPANEGRARAAIRSPTGAIATSVSAAASAMMTLFEGTLCAPIALRTICSTVEIFTKAVTVMNTNGRSDTIASATTRTMGRDEQVVRPRGQDHDGSFLPAGSGRSPRPSARDSTSANATLRVGPPAGSDAAGISPSFVKPPSPTPTTNTCSPTFTR